ncbi:hypothetical protein ACFOHQ_21555 [Xanthomonas fragariae]
MREVESSLSRYDVERLGIYEHNGVYFSEPLEFFAFLVNSEWQRIPLAQAPLRTLIPTTRPFFGNEAIELRSPTKTTYGAMLGINAYPPESKSVFLNHLLTQPFSFVLSQSFSFLQMESARWKLKLSKNRMINSGDDALSQVDEIDDAVDDLTARRWVMGDHHFSLFVKAGSLRELNDHIAEARTALSEGGITAAREDLAIASAFGRSYRRSSSYVRDCRRSTVRTWPASPRCITSRKAGAVATIGAMHSRCSSRRPTRPTISASTRPIRLTKAAARKRTWAIRSCSARPAAARPRSLPSCCACCRSSA